MVGSITPNITCHLDDKAIPIKNQKIQPPIKHTHYQQIDYHVETKMHLLYAFFLIRGEKYPLILADFVCKAAGYARSCASNTFHQHVEESIY